MIVVSHTSPINYLIAIGQINVLPVLFGRVVAPNAVLEELSHPNAPSVVREWIAKPPDWFEVEEKTSKGAQ